MKHLKLYEAFNSTVLTSVLSYLSNKFDKNTYLLFLSYLKNMLSEYNIPISSIKDSDVQYLPYNKAINVVNELSDDIDDIDKIHYLKYWFSLKEAFVGVTMVGNRRCNFSQLSEPFTPRMLEWLYGRYDIGGKLKKISHDDFKTMKDGDRIMLTTCSVFGDYETRNFSSYTIVGELFIDDRIEGDIKYYVWSDASAGDGDGPQMVRNNIRRRTNPYNYSYGLYDGAYTNLYSITGDSDGLSILSDDKSSPWDFNLPLSGSWDKNTDVERYENCDFVIVIKVDSNLSLRDIRHVRKNNKYGALSLVSNDEVRKTNISRYLGILFSRLNITPTNDFKNMNKVILSCMVNNSFLISIKGHYLTSKMADFIKHIDKLISNSDKYYQKQYLNNVESCYFSIKKNEESISMDFKANVNLVNKLSTKNNILKPIHKEIIEEDNNDSINKLLDIVTKLVSIGDYISNYYKNYDVSTLEDFQMEFMRIRSIESLIDSDTHNTSDELNSVLSNISGRESSFGNNLLYFVRRYSDELYQRDLKKIALIEKYVKLIIK